MKTTTATHVRFPATRHSTVLHRKFSEILACNVCRERISENRSVAASEAIYQRVRGDERFALILDARAVRLTSLLELS